MRNLMLTLALLVATAASAISLPKADGQTFYFIQFTSGGNVVADQGDGSECLTAAMSVSDAMLWTVSGDDTDGYTFTNKLGRSLYLSAASQGNGFLRSASTPSGYTTFAIKQNASGNGFLIAPHTNATVYLNQWQGAGSGKRIGLWSDSSDSGSMVQFVEASEVDPANVLPLIPYPASLTRGEGRLSISSLSALQCPDETLAGLFGEFAEQLRKTSGVTWSVSASPSAPNAVTMTLDETLGAEAYTLDITTEGVSVKAGGRSGFLYALQTIKQLLPWQLHGQTLAEDADWTLPALSISDSPRYGYRGFMIDVSRHFFTVEEVKTVIDIMSFYKLNRLHWHLTDDQGWRIEIPEYPKLTEVGAIRKGSFTSSGQSTTFYDDTEYGRGCYFTLDQLRDVVAYGQERGVEILPEIDMPGHMVAALASYPELSCNPTRTYEVRIDGGISTDVLDISNPDVIAFLKTVLGHVAEVFPYEYVHIGGDECPTTCWENSATCQAFAKEKGISISEMQGWLVEELGEWLRDNYGKGLVVWDELLSRWPSSNAIKPVIMAWNNISKTQAAANLGYSSIACPYQNVYLDFMQAAPASCYIDEEYFGGWTETNTNTLSDVYNLNPVGSLAGKESYMMGPQANLWAETLCNFRQLQAQMLPREVALAEVGWLSEDKKNWLSFTARLQGHDEIYDACGWVYSRHGFNQEEKTGDEALLSEAQRLLEATQPGQPGHVSQEVYDNLLSALGGGDLQTAISDYKSAAITQPTAGQYCLIVSAATYYKAKYDGSTVYALGGNVRFHYTPQLEPEEIWVFEETDGGWALKNALSDSYLSLPTYNANATTADAPTAFRVDRASVQATGGYDYLPGVVTISTVSGYSAQASGSVPRLYADVTGYVKSYNDPTLYKQGTWRIEPISDFTSLLNALVGKCRLIILKGEDGRSGTPSQAALDFLQSNLIEPASAVESCDATTYNMYMDIYREYLEMPRQSVLDSMSEDIYYRIRNAYPGFSNRYAAINASGDVVPTTDINGDNSLWRIVKGSEQTVSIINKENGKAAHVASSTADTAVRTAESGTAWTLEEFASDESAGILIRTADYSWYTNPNAWNYVLLKPYQWGACVWTFEPTATPVEPDAISSTRSNSTVTGYYDLQGRAVRRGQAAHGIYITRGQKVVQ